MGYGFFRLPSRVESRHGLTVVHQDAVTWDEPRLLAKYWRKKKFDTHIWFNNVRMKRRARLRLAFFAQWHQLEVYISADDTLILKDILNSE